MSISSDTYNYLAPLYINSRKLSDAAGTQGIADSKKASDNLSFVSDWFKNILTGSDDSLLKMFDVSGLNKNIDENQQQLAETGVRGGSRAAGLGQSSFDRDAAINKALQALRFAAPEHIAAIAGQIGSLGVAQESVSNQASDAAAKDVGIYADQAQHEKDRKDALIGSIFAAIGGIAGAALCVADYTRINTPVGEVRADSLAIAREVLSNGIVRKITRFKISKNQPTRVIYVHKNLIEVTPSHVFQQANGEEVLCSELRVGDLLNGKEILVIKPSEADVVIFKLDGEENNYTFKSNGFTSLDDDCKIV